MRYVILLTDPDGVVIRVDQHEWGWVELWDVHGLQGFTPIYFKSIREAQKFAANDSFFSDEGGWEIATTDELFIRRALATL